MFYQTLFISGGVLIYLFVQLFHRCRGAEKAPLQRPAQREDKKGRAPDCTTARITMMIIIAITILTRIIVPVIVIVIRILLIILIIHIAPACSTSKKTMPSTSRIARQAA